MKLLLVTLLFAVSLLLVALLLLGVKVLFVKGGKFPSGHVGSSAALRRRGIRCAHSEETDGHPGQQRTN